jgi:hypothetical protein
MHSVLSQAAKEVVDGGVDSLCHISTPRYLEARFPELCPGRFVLCKESTSVFKHCDLAPVLDGSTIRVGNLKACPYCSDV